MVGKDANLPGRRSGLGREGRGTPKALLVPEVSSHRPLVGARCNNGGIRCPSRAEGEGISAGGAALKKWWKNCGQETVKALAEVARKAGLQAWKVDFILR